MKQNNSFQRAEQLLAGGRDGGRLPGADTLPSRTTASSTRARPGSLSQSFKYVPTDLQQGTLYSWNVAFQRELFCNLTAEVAYVGNYEQ